ncbi:CRISPR-associated helicase Cas3' [Tissierella praeacuta]|uniref:CRISPR-associated helicase Cas3' n=1 Tax=Tissierella praeacuta TaxID=43131 RepID=UPI0033401102
MEYLAKSRPKETIQEHTERLIENWETLKELYPNINITWELLYLACLYHDLGKLNEDFQNKIRGKRIENEIPHAYLSVGFLPTIDILDRYGKDGVKILVNSIIYHHERNFEIDIDINLNYINDKIKNLNKEIEIFQYERVPNLQSYNFPLRYYSVDRIHEKDGVNVFHEYIKVKGMLNRLDHASSAHEKVEYKSDFLEEGLKKLLNTWDGGNPLQQYMRDNRDKNIIAIAQTGMGKTEAGLLWIGNNKGFFTLPLKVAINAIYDRVVSEIVLDKLDERVGVLHSDSFSEYIKRNDAKEGLSRYYDRTKLLSLPLTISTLDQLFDFVYRYKGFELKLATLSYSRIVIDEIQMYSPELIAYLIYGLKLITDIGGKFAILTATFPPIFEKLLISEGIKYDKPAPFIEEEDKIRHSIKVIDKLISPEFIVEQSKINNRVLVICNTVKTAQELYETLERNYEPENLNLIHSYFTMEDRSKKEVEILKLGEKESDGRGIWIGTQILEASLDIDFDVLITELSDINGLFQRLGRCYRKRYFKLDNGYNAYVFTGRDKRIRGIGFVVDKKIFEISKEALKDLDGPLSESKKLQIINNTYTNEKLKDSKYLNDIEGTMEYLKSIYTNEKTKKEVNYMFRNINNISIIPETVYNKNEVEINKNKDILDYDSEQKYSREDRAKARNEINKFKISIPYYSFKDSNNRVKEINEYEYLNIYKCNYDDKFGFTNVIEDEIDDGEPNNIV